MGPAVIKVGNLNSVRTFQDARDAIRAYYLVAVSCESGDVTPGQVFNIAGEEVFKLTEVIEVLLSSSSDISVEFDVERDRPIDADYQMFDNSKLKSAINWRPEIKSREMFNDLLEHWRRQIRD